jgi:hypothetical protein
VCGQHPAACSEQERARALASAQDNATGAPETLRAMAANSADRREAVELLRRATERDPLSPWNSVLSAQSEPTQRARSGTNSSQ